MILKCPSPVLGMESLEGSGSAHPLGYIIIEDAK